MNYIKYKLRLGVFFQAIESIFPYMNINFNAPLQKVVVGNHFQKNAHYLIPDYMIFMNIDDKLPDIYL